MLNKLKSIHKSCHHGVKDFENQLEPAKSLTNYDIMVNI